MNNSQPEIKNASGENPGLPLKITGIVFWGMTLLGVVAGLILVSDYNSTLEKSYNVRVQSVAFSVSQILVRHPNASNDAMRVMLDPIVIKNKLLGLKLDYNNDSIQVGDYMTACNPFALTLPVAGSSLSVCLPDIKEAANNYRKNFLILMGLLLFTFGMLLQVILKKMITAPFMLMVESAKNILNGQSSVRFDEKRSDEFGFISKFINQVLNQELNKSIALEEAIRQIELADISIKNEKERVEITLESLADAVISTDKDFNVLSINGAAESMTGWSKDLAIGEPLGNVLKLYSLADENMVDIPVGKCLEDGERLVNISGVLLGKDNRNVDVHLSVVPIYTHTLEAIGVVVALQDVGKALKLERKLSYQARHDGLTGLFNRNEFEQQMGLLIESANKNNQKHVLCFMDLDQFKIVNDSSGHVAGDEMLKQISSMFQANIRSSDILARLGGDEFGLLLPCCSMEKACELADTLRQLIEKFRFHWDGKLFEVGLSIGIVLIDESSENIIDVMASADIACYTAKENGRNCIQTYEAENHVLEERRGQTEWLAKINDALKNDKFCLYYQPIASIKESSSAELHVELLVRMLDDSGRLIPPMAFIPAAERFKLMPELDRWVIHAFLDFLSKELMGGADVWPKGVDYLFNINLSGGSIGNRDLLRFVKEQLEIYKIPPDVICFEITETAAISHLENATEFIDSMKRVGCHFALDDFGSGLCSFSYLKNLPVDYLKIDGSYVKGIVENNIDRELVMSVNHIGHVFGMKTVAECVENLEVLNHLAKIGVDYAQGYGIQEPRPINEMFSNISKAHA